MNPQGPIIIIEDDKEETEMLLEIISGFNFRNPVSIISNSGEAVAFLRNAPDPFIILSGINLRGINGFQLRNAILEDHCLAQKCTPYIFYSAHATDETHSNVEKCKAHGYLHDINDYDQLRIRLHEVMQYWQISSGSALM
jgi:CheY-like chemotaxis protein